MAKIFFEGTPGGTLGVGKINAKINSIFISSKLEFFDKNSIILIPRATPSFSVSLQYRFLSCYDFFSRYNQ